MLKRNTLPSSRELTAYRMGHILSGEIPEEGAGKITTPRYMYLQKSNFTELKKTSRTDRTLPGRGLKFQMW